MKATITLPVDDADAAFALHVFAAILNYENDMGEADLGFFSEQVPKAISSLILSLGAISWDGYTLEKGDMWNGYNSESRDWDKALQYLKTMIKRIEMLRPVEALPE